MNQSKQLMSMESLFFQGLLMRIVILLVMQLIFGSVTSPEQNLLKKFLIK